MPEYYINNFVLVLVVMVYLEGVLSASGLNNVVVKKIEVFVLWVLVQVLVQFVY
jgi:hypothetical protein